jgi:hypothetical protein
LKPNAGELILQQKAQYENSLSNMSDIDKTKLLIIGQSCNNCKFNGIFDRRNFMHLPECYYPQFSINPRQLSNTNICKDWQQYEQ